MQPASFEKKWNTNENILTAAFSGDGNTLAVALLDGTALLVNTVTGEEKRLTVHPGAVPLSFCAGANETAFLSGGDDGQIVRFSWHEQPVSLAEHKGKWVDHVAASAAGDRHAYSVGREVYLGGRDTPLPHPSNVGGLAFSPNGKRLAVSHYNGVSLWWVRAQDSQPQTLLWKGSHLGLLWHPAGDYLITAMQEPALHGWHLKNSGELRMAGYPGKVRSMGFSTKGRWLATAGADQIICWPFFGSGPQGKPPMALGIPEGKPCTVVAPHPADELTAAGFGSGRIVLALFEDRLPIELLPPDGVAATTLCWSPDGRHLVSGHEDGRIHLFSSESIIAATKAAASGWL